MGGRCRALRQLWAERGVFLAMRRCVTLPFLAAAVLAGSAAVMPVLAADQSAPKPSVPAASPPPAPAVPPPIASHADPKAPVPTNPPEQIAPPAKLHEPAVRGGSGANAPTPAR
jgi:hypothetical protein